MEAEEGPFEGIVKKWAIKINWERRKLIIHNRQFTRMNTTKTETKAVSLKKRHFLVKDTFALAPLLSYLFDYD